MRGRGRKHSSKIVSRSLAVSKENKAVIPWAAGNKYDRRLIEADGSVLVAALDVISQI